ncbi:MAG: HNH endonuclease [Candidatus Lindowbacteria bacterium]|nr:HNH endonuclease [Candidatus Lindowbacteria bacterium]
MNAEAKNNLHKYEDAFASLRVGRCGGHDRPHKPLMLLAVMDLVESGRISENKIHYEPELLERFKAYFDLVKSQDDSLTPLLPFFFLRGDKFWHHKPRQGQEPVYAALSDPGGRAKFLDIIDYTYLDEDLFHLLQNPETRDRLRETLIRRYFPSHRTAIDACINKERPIAQYEEFLRKKVVSKAAEAETPFAPEAARDVAFSRVVRAAYDFRCAACGLRVYLDDGTILVDAAHLVPFSVTGDNDPRNGMALCKNHHWAMDRNLIVPAISGSRHLWKVSKDLEPRIEGQKDLLMLDGVGVLMPKDKRYYPKTESLKWRMDHLRGCA